MKRTFALVIALIMVLALAGCKKPVEPQEELGGTYDITVWVADAIVDLTTQQINAFNENNEYGIKFNFTVEAVGEGDAATKMTADVEAGGDIFCFPQDQFARLVQASALSKLGVGAAETVKTANSAGVVSAATTGGELYAYPLTADNGYFMYYDKTVIPESDIDSLDKIVEDCEAANKYIAYQLVDNGWYLSGFFFSTGCVSNWESDADGKFLSVNDDFNSDNGLIAAKAVNKLMNSKMYLNNSSASSFDSGAAVVISGTWDSSTAKGILGDNLGVADLPNITVDGKDYHLWSFNGCKLMGVKPQTDAKKGSAIHKLAQYLTDEARQLERFNAVGWGPANLAAQANEAVQADAALAALFAQSAYSVPQGQIPGNWWDNSMKPLGEGLKNATDEAALKAALEAYQTSLGDYLKKEGEEEVPDTWGVVGSMTNWGDGTEDFAMTEIEAGVFESAVIELHAGDEFKVRSNNDWTVNYGADGAKDGANIVVEADGNYKVQFVLETGMITLVPAE